MKNIGNSYKTRKTACEMLGISYPTLYKLAEKGEIDTIMIGKQQLYNVNTYFTKIKSINPNKKNICYCRVLNKKHKNDLNEQIKSMTSLYPDYEIISDIGSGMDYERAGLMKILDYAIKGEIENVVISNKDKLVKFGYELIENIIKLYSNGKIVVLNTPNETTQPDEISKEITAILNAYPATTGLKKHKQALIDELTNKK
ncbi:putative serine recombinase [Bodo saltans virus]|uniref:Serine recombinase n=1 Tax=Bodo saltans virus TaxID=2024608 RepID=A0A2H4UTD8_9VIRU|nr:putative serine recombinase [Bodo saltans virus]ATZ80201.1 putative serine recombinase [Bodo saltans virus]